MTNALPYMEGGDSCPSQGGDPRLSPEAGGGEGSVLREDEQVCTLALGARRPVRFKHQ